jgi:polysaccharide deacetylase family protein (PEP-CTERM system associated)
VSISPSLLPVDGLVKPPPIVNALTVDVEEYYHALVFREGAPGAVSGGLESRVEASTGRVLALFAYRDVTATFFVLGQVASEHPAIVRKIAGEGHEVACHGYAHEPVSRQTPAEFRADIRRAKATLEDIIGESVLGYRAPNFSIGSAEAWAYDILLEEGFRYDSSIYPILHDRYGDRTAPRFPYEIRRNGHGGLIQFPIGTTRLFGVNLPIGGGGYFRILPSATVRSGIRRVNSRERQPIAFYFHPWEMDPDQPRPLMSWRHRFRHYVGLRSEEDKLLRLLREFRFSTVRNVLGL